MQTRTSETLLTVGQPALTDGPIDERSTDLYRLLVSSTLDYAIRAQYQVPEHEEEDPWRTNVNIGALAYGGAWLPGMEVVGLLPEDLEAWAAGLLLAAREARLRGSLATLQQEPQPEES